MRSQEERWEGEKAQWIDREGEGAKKAWEENLLSFICRGCGYACVLDESDNHA